jgi:hypothetical protein
MKNTKGMLKYAGISLATLALALSAALPSVSQAHAGPHGGVDTSPEPTGPSPFTVIASGLSNPRGIAISALPGHEAIYVSEAGNGGKGGMCLTSANGDYDDCYGASGAITKIANGNAQRVITGLPSIAGPNGGFAIGPSHMALVGPALVITMANYGDPEQRGQLTGADKRFGNVVIHSLVSNHSQMLANLSAFEDSYNPAGGDAESNPGGMALAHGGFLATDAGANSLLHIGIAGRVSLRYAFPTRLFPAPPFMGLPAGATVPVESVPVTVVRGPDHAHYVAEFTGFPFPKGGARVLRFGATGAPTVFADGFSNIIDIAFGPDGSLYVLEMARNGMLSQDVTGAVTKVARNGTRTLIAASGLAYPTAIAVDRHGSVYVTNYGTHGTKAQLVRL